MNGYCLVCKVDYGKRYNFKESLFYILIRTMRFYQKVFLIKGKILFKRQKLSSNCVDEEIDEKKKKDNKWIM